MQEQPLTSKRLGFDDVKHFISYYESTNGQFKFHLNANGTIDCGIYQINSSHFDPRTGGDRPIALVFDSIFSRYRVSKKVSERIVEAIRNDKLNEDLARSMYEMRGINQWVAYKRFAIMLEGYQYIHDEVPKVRSRVNGRKG